MSEYFTKQTLLLIYCVFVGINNKIKQLWSYWFWEFSLPMSMTNLRSLITTEVLNEVYGFRCDGCKVYCSLPCDVMYGEMYQCTEQPQCYVLQDWRKIFQNLQLVSVTAVDILSQERSLLIPILWVSLS